MGVFVKGQKLDSKKLKRVKFQLPEQTDADGKPCYIVLRAMSVAEGMQDQKDAEAFKESVAQAKADGQPEPKDDGRQAFKIIARCACNDAGEPIFDDAEDAEANLAVGAESFSEMVKKILSLSGMAVTDVTPKK